MDQNRIATYLDAAVEAARNGGETLQAWRTHFAVKHKGQFDLLTDADLASQNAVREALRERFPDHSFLGEESPGSSRLGANAPATWIVDPLDGTTNYVHDCPGYCVSVGLWEAGELVVGVVFDASRGELFRAAKGQGAWLGDRQLKVSGVASLDRALVAMESPYGPEARAGNAEDWRILSLASQAARQLGSTALDLAYVAAGRLDAFWGPRETHPWDVAAGAVLVREAGGLVTNSDGAGFDPFREDVAATNGRIHAALLAAVGRKH